MANLVEMLKAAARDEHAAIIQYLLHAYAMGEGEEACEIEGIAREEMRHFWILSRWIVKLQGIPTIERGFTDLGGETKAEWMDRDVQAEDRAIAMYRSYIAVIEDPALRSDLERILADEERHREMFLEFGEKFRREQALAPEEAPAPSVPSPFILEALDWGIRHEYAAILQYLFHSFLTKDEEVSRQLELQAINEMQHLGWLAEKLAALGKPIPIEHHPVDLSREVRQMLEADIDLEAGTAHKYEIFLEKVEDPSVKELLKTLRTHELYHENLFKRLLERIRHLSPSGWTVGSLIKSEKEG
ncbi:MAG: ferritin-like domain-containing protein [Anaerolineae bacterium]|nr:ferritin-like domain-containing protein [Anaerolineae bacterium]MDW8102206.1 ferritin-like domain-containing protein [Anaerolineae bacterium]